MRPKARKKRTLHSDSRSQQSVKRRKRKQVSSPLSKGTVPPLPSEMIFKIWSYMDGVPCEFRAVCRLWKSFWESTHHLKKAVARLRITADNDKYIVERWSSKSSKCIEVDRVCKAHLSIILSLIEITKVMCQGRCYYGSLWLGGEAANAEVLAAIASQKWHITKVRLFGDLGNLTADSLCEFFETINGANGGAEVRDLRIADFILADDCLCDRLVSAMHPKLSEFHILPSLTSVAETSITEQSLQRLFMPGMSICLPPCSRISLQHLQNAINKYMAAAGNFNSNGSLDSSTSGGMVVGNVSIALINWDAFSLDDLAAVEINATKQIFLRAPKSGCVEFFSLVENVFKEISVKMIRVEEQHYYSMLKDDLFLDSDDESVRSVCDGSSDSSTTSTSFYTDSDR